MFLEQKKIGSGFGMRTTAAEILSGVDMTDKLVIVTGGYSGLGLETTRAFANAGAKVMVPARRLDLAERETREINDVELAELDLADLSSVQRFANDFLRSNRSVDVLINNAGIMACPETRTKPGWEIQFAVNHLGHFALVNYLWPALANGGARVISVSSAGHHFSDVHWDDLEFRNNYDKWEAYGQAKTANALFAVGLDDLGKSSGVRAFSLHPGSISTPLQRYIPREEMIASGWIDDQGQPIGTFKSPEQGASTQIWAATSVQLNGLGGLYCEDCDVAEVTNDKQTPLVGVREYAIDPEKASRLWGISARLTGVNAFI